MTIAVIGTGNVGSALGTRWAQHGHDVTFGSRHPDSDDVTALVQRAGPNASATRPAEAARDADVVVLATPWTATRDAVTNLGDLGQSILVDCTNPLKPDGSGLAVHGDTSGGEKVAEWAQGGRVVKAFNTTGAGNMADAETDYEDPRLAMMIAGEDDAKATVSDLAETLGFEPIDVGPLSQARHLESLAMLWISLAYVEGLGPDFGFALLRRKA